MIDCGFSLKETEARLNLLGMCPSELKAVLVTHEHGDHAKGVAALARKYGTPVYMSRGTALEGKFSVSNALNLIASEQEFNIAGFSVVPVTVPHDAREPLQFGVSFGGLTLGVLTDLGSYTPAVINAYSGCDALLIEANHDLDLLANGPYPPSLQRRVASAWGHLNNQQTVELLQNLDLANTQHLVIGHISQKNNSLERVQQALLGLVHTDASLTFASQDMGFGWIQLDSRQVIA